MLFTMKAEQLQTFGARVRTLRQLAGMTQPELVAAAHKRARRMASDVAPDDVKEPFSQGYLSKLENDGARPMALPNGNVIRIMADVLETTADFLLGRTFDPNPAPAGIDAITPEARRAAQLIDMMSPEERRHALNLLVSSAKMNAQATDAMDRRLERVMESIERLAGADVRRTIESSIKP
ncbi:MAG: helix-turn-helix transcriptional regulator [Caldilinea sp.]|nr:helix-turn-helix transcriptional regulator [Caldilinea sp.]